MNIEPLFIKLGAIALIAGSLAVAAGMAYTTSGGLPKRLYDEKTEELDRQFRALFIKADAKQIVNAQIAFSVVLLLLALFLGKPLLIAGVALAVIAPRAFISRQRVEVTNKIEEQLAHWLTLLANALRASPSIPAAIEASARLIPPPIQHHVELVLREIKLGQPAELALRNMGHRVDSYTVKNALATIMIGQRTGGNVPHLLEESASGLREMARLESLIRAKTAEGKGQMMVLAMIPVALVFLLETLKSGWFDPFFENGPKGYFVLGIGVALWAGAIFISNRILDIEV